VVSILMMMMIMMNNQCFSSYSPLWAVSCWLFRNCAVEELDLCAVELEKMVEGCDSKSVFCWQTCAPQIWSHWGQGIFLYSFVILLFCVEKLWSMDVILRRAENFYIFFHHCGIGCTWKFMPGTWITGTCCII
jgi:hypothetical protein